MAALASENQAERTRAFDSVTQIYWTPLFRYAQIAHHRTDADDLTQAFLAGAFERESLATYDPSKASFRTFLRTLFDRFIANDVRAASRLKRGGNLVRDELPEKCDRPNPEELFQREWARSICTIAVDQLRATLDPVDFEIFEEYDLRGGVKYREVAERLSLTEATITNRLAGARRRFREAVLELLRQVTVSEAEFRSEARTLLGVDV